MKLSKIYPGDEIYVYEIPAMDNEEKDKDNEEVIVRVVHQKKEKNLHYRPGNTYTNTKEYRTINIGLPRIVRLPMGEVEVSVIYQRIAAVVLGDPSAELPFKIYMLEEDCQRCYSCDHRKLCDGCELVNEEGATVEIKLEEARNYQSQRSVLCAFGLIWPGEGEENEYDLEKDEPKLHESMSNSKSQKSSISVTNCLAEFTKKETLSEQDPWYCKKCKKHQLATKKFDLYKLPDILIIHLKRFCYTRYHRQKITSLVDFPLKGLKLDEFCKNDDMKDTEYDLYAVSNHMGNLGGGHYTAYAKNIKDQKWYDLNDSRTSSVDESSIVSRNAYVLFYAKKEK